MSFRTKILAYGGQPLTQQVLFHILKSYKRPIDKIHELVKSGELKPLKRGLFMAGEKLKLPQPEPFLIANILYGPSYVSFESALSYWGMIPEKVYEIKSATTNSSSYFKNTSGKYSYKHLKLPYYSYGIQLHALTEQQSILIACPEKALCDKIIATAGLQFRSPKQVIQTLLEDLRLERSTLQNLKVDLIKTWLDDAPKKNSLSMLVKTLDGLW